MCITSLGINYKYFFLIIIILVLTFIANVLVCSEYLFKLFQVYTMTSRYKCFVYCLLKKISSAYLFLKLAYLTLNNWALGRALKYLEFIKYNLNFEVHLIK